MASYTLKELMDLSTTSPGVESSRMAFEHLHRLIVSKHTTALVPAETAIANRPSLIRTHRAELTDNEQMLAEAAATGEDVDVSGQ